MRKITTVEQIRELAQDHFDEYNDNDIDKVELFNRLHYPLWLCANRFVQTNNTSFTDLSADILGLIQDIEHA